MTEPLKRWQAIYRARRHEVETGVRPDGGLPPLDPQGVTRLCQLIVSIEAHGYDHSEPVLVNQYGRIVDGRHRLAACHLLGTSSRGPDTP
jgi:ParB/Sulfiredoxin domain